MLPPSSLEAAAEISKAVSPRSPRAQRPSLKIDTGNQPEMRSPSVELKEISSGKKNTPRRSPKKTKAPTVEYFDEEGLRHFLDANRDSSSGKQDELGYLQLWVDPKPGFVGGGRKNFILRVQWSPHVCLVLAKANLHKMNAKNVPMHDTNEQYKCDKIRNSHSQYLPQLLHEKFIPYLTNLLFSTEYIQF